CTIRLVDITEASVSGRKTRCDCVRRKSRNVMKYKAIIKKVGGKYEIDPAIICAILDKNGWGDHGMSFGLMQIGTQILINTKEQHVILTNIIVLPNLMRMDGYTTQDYPVMLPKLNTLHNGY
uniref:Uncharacterized protein n=1 Tax=Oncorhynchus tshawytscha TaxID=74940 RepID=A0A8C8K6W8_ONCTS